jgi:hypothetical protein
MVVSVVAAGSGCTLALWGAALASGRAGKLGWPERLPGVADELGCGGVKIIDVNTLCPSGEQCRHALSPVRERIAIS